MCSFCYGHAPSACIAIQLAVWQELELDAHRQQEAQAARRAKKKPARKKPGARPANNIAARMLQTVGYCTHLCAWVCTCMLTPAVACDSRLDAGRCRQACCSSALMRCRHHQGSHRSWPRPECPACHRAGAPPQAERPCSRGPVQRAPRQQAACPCRQGAAQGRSQGQGSFPAPGNPLQASFSIASHQQRVKSSHP